MRSLAAVLALLALPSIAAAQTTPTYPPPGSPPPGSPPPGSPPPPAPAPAAEVQASTTSVGTQNDANIDRTILMPTAETQPRGSFSFNDYELFVLGVTYGVTDDVQITASTLVAMGDMPWVGVLSGKWRFLDAGRVHLAAQASFFFFQERNDSQDDDSFKAGTLGGILSLCIDDDCTSLATASVTAGFGLDAQDDDVTPLFYGGSLVHKIGRRTKLLLEVASAGVFENGDWESASGALLSYGIRFHTGEIAGDIAFVRPIGGDSSEFTDEFPMGFPFVSFTYRTN